MNYTLTLIIFYNKRKKMIIMQKYYTIKTK